MNNIESQLDLVAAEVAQRFDAYVADPKTLKDALGIRGRSPYATALGKLVWGVSQLAGLLKEDPHTIVERPYTIDGEIYAPLGDILLPADTEVVTPIPQDPSLIEKGYPGGGVNFRLNEFASVIYAWGFRPRTDRAIQALGVNPDRITIPYRPTNESNGYYVESETLRLVIEALTRHVLDLKPELARGTKIKSLFNLTKN